MFTLNKQTYSQVLAEDKLIAFITFCLPFSMCSSRDALHCSVVSVIALSGALGCECWPAI